MGDDLELLTVEEVSELLQVHPDSVRRMMRQGRLPAVKVGWQWYVRRSDFDRLFEKAGQGQPGARG